MGLLILFLICLVFNFKLTAKQFYLLGDESLRCGSGQWLVTTVNSFSIYFLRMDPKPCSILGLGDTEGPTLTETSVSLD